MNKIQLLPRPAYDVRPFVDAFARQGLEVTEEQAREMWERAKESYGPKRLLFTTLGDGDKIFVNYLRPYFRVVDAEEEKS